MTSLYSSSLNSQINNIVENKKKIIAQVKILYKDLCLKEDILLKTWFPWPRTSIDKNKTNFLFCFGCVNSSKALDIMKSVLIFFIEEFMVLTKKKIDNGPQCQVYNNFDHYYTERKN